jgi:mycofactocin precursor
MSERVATGEVLDRTEVLDSTEVTDRPEEPELATADLLVEEVSIDGMCGVY